MASKTQTLIKIGEDKVETPCYEVIKKEDIENAFRDALEKALMIIVAKLNGLISAMSTSAQPSLWTWDFTSRWDYDMWA